MTTSVGIGEAFPREAYRRDEASNEPLALLPVFQKEVISSVIWCYLREAHGYTKLQVQLKQGGQGRGKYPDPFSGTGHASGNTMAIVAAEAPESSSHTGKGALVAHNPADAAMPAWFSQFMTMDKMHRQTAMEKLHSVNQNSQLVLNKMEDMVVGSYTAFGLWRCQVVWLHRCPA